MVLKKLLTQRNKFKIVYSYDVNNMMFTSSCRTLAVKLFLYGILILIVFTLSFVPQMISSNIKPNNLFNDSLLNSTDLKYVLFWERPVNTDTEKYITGQIIFHKQNCAFTNCFLTYNKSLFKELKYFDAIVFNVRKVNNLKINELNASRSPKQKFIFKSLESSEKTPICDPETEGFFNWTWTYKLSSDIPHPYFNIYDMDHKLIGPRRNMKWTYKMAHDRVYKTAVSTKTKAIAWIIKDCRINPKHLEFVNELRVEMINYSYEIDLYGQCERECPGTIDECYKMIEKDYFFLLVLEDSYAYDYVSEEVVRAMNSIILPIVWGGAAYTSFLPPGSYINVKEFDLKKLAAIIDFLIKNPTTYEYFFDWKKHYYYTPRPKSYVCDLCTKLNHKNSDSKYKFYKNFRQWWYPGYKKYCEKKSLLDTLKLKLSNKDQL